MRNKKMFFQGLAGATLIWGGVAAAGVVTAEQLGGEARPIVYLSTDKPIYRTGEKLYIRAIALDALTNFPTDIKRGAKIEIINSRGETVFSTYRGGSEGPAFGAAWEIPGSLPGGEYTLRVTAGQSAPAERRFEIRSYAVPRFKTQIEFLRDGYVPGDTVTATINVTRAEGGVPEKAVVTAIARLDGAEIFRREYSGGPDADGNLTVSFPLPESIFGGDGTLAFVIADGGVVGNAAKTIPILLDNYEINFYPEGGDLVAGLPQRVYVEARRRDGKPADISATVGETEVSTVHEGRGVFTIVPEAGRRAELRLKSGRSFTLPEAKRSGAVLRAEHESYPFDGKIAVEVNSTVDSGASSVAIFKRELELSRQPLTPGRIERVELDPGDSEGVLTVTVFDAAGKPLAERLVFREPRFHVNIELGVEAPEFVPGAEVRLFVKTTDGNGSPVGAIVHLAAVDESLLEMVEKREQPPQLPVMVYLENETRDLADAHVYFDPGNPEAARDIDLLLGTQGWRRFILFDFERIRSAFDLPARRVLGMLTPLPRAVPMMAAATAVRQEENIPAAETADEAVAKMRPPNADKPLPKPAAVPEAGGDEMADRGAPILREAADIVAADIAVADKPLARKIVAPGGDGNIVVIREYAHQTRPNRRPNDRIDFTETIYWNCGVATNPRNGVFETTFKLPDSVTSFRISADAAGNNGALGAAVTNFTSREPFYIEPKLPVSVVAGDVVELPVALVNSTDRELAPVQLVVKGEGLEVELPEPLPALAPGARERVMVKLKTKQPGNFPLVISGVAGGSVDRVTRELRVVPRLFPVKIQGGGMVGPERDFRIAVTIPSEVEPGTLTASLRVTPTPLASLEAALNALLREPHGCFEQASSTNYPVVMVRQYQLLHSGIAPEQLRRTGELLEDGYRKLVGFETSERGYEWFGAAPGHEALTAYGLMEFTEMAELMPVDPEMLSRTREWLLARRDGSGGFRRNEKALDSFGRAPAPVTNAYILWTLLESGTPPAELAREIAAVKTSAAESDDSYLKALAVNILALAGDLTSAERLAAELSRKQQPDGAVAGGKNTITCSGGASLTMETTALAVLGWLRLEESFVAETEKAMLYISEQCKNGRFGSTQATILALKAINAYSQLRSKPLEPGELQLWIDGAAFGRPVAFTRESTGIIELPDFAGAMTPGEHVIELRMKGGSPMPAMLAIECNTPQPDNSTGAPLRISTALSAAQVTEGEPLEMTVSVVNTGDEATMPIAVVGIPAGARPRYEQLRELAKSGRIAAWEESNGELVLYWRGLHRGENRTVPVSLLAETPGSYRATPSRAYLYYQDEDKFFAPGPELKVTAEK